VDELMQYLLLTTGKNCCQNLYAASMAVLLSAACRKRFQGCRRDYSNAEETEFIGMNDFREKI
jgi:hypothetical protein